MVLACSYKLFKITKFLEQYKTYWIAVAERTLRTRPILIDLYFIIQIV